MLVLVAAMGRNRVIGVDGSLPWHLPEDLKRFKALTLGKPLIMGRATFDSVGRVLEGRTNIVVSRDRDLAVDGALVAFSPGHALVLALREGSDEIMVAGGGTIYRQYLAMASRIELTLVDLAPPGDITFPELDDSWRLHHQEPGPSTTPGTVYQTYVRRQQETSRP